MWATRQTIGFRSAGSCPRGRRQIKTLLGDMPPCKRPATRCWNRIPTETRARSHPAQESTATGGLCRRQTFPSWLALALCEVLVCVSRTQCIAYSLQSFCHGGWPTFAVCLQRWEPRRLVVHVFSFMRGCPRSRRGCETWEHRQALRLAEAAPAEAGGVACSRCPTSST